MKWQLSGDRSQWPLVMGILNVTPDSFSDGGRFLNKDHALRQVDAMVEAGADLIDIGGESTRPGAKAVSQQQELDRVLPVIESIKAHSDVVVSIDTTKAAVMEAAVEAGADMINDVTALSGEHSLATASRLQVPVCLMHMRGTPGTMQKDPHYDDVVDDVKNYLSSRVAACVEAGMPASQVIVDPGFGFGKTLEHNLQLFYSLQEVASGQPLLVGVSRKSMIGAVLEREVDERLSGSIALASLATWLRAAIIRVHDVPETLDAVRMVRAVRNIQTLQSDDLTGE